MARIALARRISITDILFKITTEKGIDEAIRQYHELKSAHSDQYNFKEDQLNDLGYQLIEGKKYGEAVQILKLNAEVYPHSSNAYDSLGEAYLDSGDKTHAIESYKKSLQLDPDNADAVQELKQLNAR
jgi:tetratricopeptide (TPR) repeat protein